MTKSRMPKSDVRCLESDSNGFAGEVFVSWLGIENIPYMQSFRISARTPKVNDLASIGVVCDLVADSA